LIKLDTNGSNPRRLENLIETREVDFVSMDVKAPLDPFYEKYLLNTAQLC
jgi:pyruvate-formate lyase-activating enzyme